MSNLIIDPHTKIYSRYTNSNNELLKSKLKQFYNCSNITIANSGLHANFLGLNTILQSTNINNIVYINELYYESINLIKSYNNNLIQTHIINILDDKSIIDLFKSDKLFNKSNVLFIESCTNPNGYIFNYELISELRSLSDKLFIICDNSWLSNYIFNPFDYDIDIITISLTKYYSGGNAIGGTCIIKNDILHNILDNYIKLTGIHISSLQTTIININIDQTYNRLIISSDLTSKVIYYLLNNNYNYDIHIGHPYINKLTLNLAKRYFKDNLYPSTFTFGIKINKNILSKLLEKLTILLIETSFGSKLTILDNHIYVIDDLSYIRISIGYEDIITRIISGLNELFELIKLEKCLCF